MCGFCVEAPYLTGDETKDWNPLERITVKHMGTGVGMEKVLLFMGAIERFRSEPQKAVRSKKAVDKGYLVPPDTTGA